MRVCSLLSGGKDSNFALYTAILRGYEVSCIIVVHPSRSDSWMFHAVNTGLAVLQAKAMNMEDRVVEVRVSGVREREVAELEAALRRVKESLDFDAIAMGALASLYQRRRIEAIASRLGVEVYAPYWGADPEEYMRLLARSGMEFVITRISTMGLSPGLLARPIREAEVEEIIRSSRASGFHPAFEGGEAETLVVDAPHYHRRLCLEGRAVRLGPYEYELRVSRAWLGPKGSGCLSVEGLGVEEPLGV